MQEKLSSRIMAMGESETLAMARKSRELSAQGVNVINLSLGEPDFNTPDFIKEAAKEAIDKNFSSYTPVPGYNDLREAICHKFKRDNNLHYSPDQVMASTGAKHSIANVVMALVNPGDEVIIPAPYWVSYREIVNMAEGKAVYVFAGIQDDFKFTAAQLEAAITPQTKLIIFSSPCNPSGSVLTHDELASIADVLRRNPHVMVIADEIYEHIIFDGKNPSLAAFDGMQEQVITVNGLSKGFAMTGWRLGYIGGPKWVVDACTKMQGQFTSATCSITQRAAIAALNADPEPIVKPMREAFLRRRDLVVNLFSLIPGVKCNVPQGAFYLFPDVSSYFGKAYNGQTIANANDLSMYLLQTGHVATVAGDAFGAPQCIRLSYATSDNLLQEAAARIANALQNLQ